MNIQAQCCGIALMLILLYYYIQRKKLLFRTDRAFLCTLLLAILCVTLDAVSIVAITNLNIWPYTLIVTICKAYLCALVFVALSSFLYSLDEIYTQTGEWLLPIRIVYNSLALLGCIMIGFMPISIHVGETSTDVYTYGNSVLTTYFFCVFILLSNFYLIFRRKKQMNRHRRKAILSWMILWVTTSVIQFLNNELLLVGYALSLGMMFLYLKLENPEIYKDRNTGLYNRLYLQTLLTHLFDVDESRSLLVIYLMPSSYDQRHNSFSPELLTEVGLYFNALPHVTAFEYAENEYVLLTDTQYSPDEILELIQQRFSCGWGVHETNRIDIHCTLLRDQLLLTDKDELLNLLRYVSKNTQDYMSENIRIVDEKMLEDMYAQQRLETLLLDAVENDRLEVFFQPIYSVGDSSFTSAEALVRIRTAQGDLVPPGQFIPLAESNGMILRIGEIVFEKVCQFLKEHNPEKLGLHYIEVNLSVVQCGYEPLADKYIAIMEQYQINPQWINLEITESASLSTKKTLLENMHKLIDYGVRFSLDDFGTGQSNLNYIIDMPVDIVKFDKDMINSYFENGKAKYVMDAAMQMIKGLHLSIVSEGIEKKEQYDIMRDLGIEYIQGYYFSKPLSVEEYLEFLSSRNSAESHL